MLFFENVDVAVVVVRLARARRDAGGCVFLQRDTMVRNA